MSIVNGKYTNEYYINYGLENSRYRFTWNYGLSYIKKILR